MKNLILNRLSQPVRYEYICDICKKETRFRQNKCVICGRDICSDCRIDAARNSAQPEWYCKLCFTSKDLYIKELKILEEDYKKKLVVLKTKICNYYQRQDNKAEKI